MGDYQYYQEQNRKRNHSEDLDEYESFQQPKNVQMRVDMPIPENCVGLVIGRNGAEIRNISENASCKVIVNTQQNGSGFRMVEITGTPGNIDVAKRMITDVVGRAASTPLVSILPAAPTKPNPSEQITVELMIPSHMCGVVIGKKGETMRKLREWSNCYITLMQETNEAISDKPLKITGTPEAVEKAKKLVANVIALKATLPENMAGNGPDATMTLQLRVPRKTVGAIMGLKGSTIRKMSEDTGVKIQFLPDDDKMMIERTLALIGSRYKVNIAAQLIKDIVERNTENANTPVTIFCMSIPASKAGLVIGRGGEVIKQINRQSGALCEISNEMSPNPSEKMFVIRGSEGQVDHAKFLITQRVGDIPPDVSYIPRIKERQLAPPPPIPPIPPNLQFAPPNPAILQNPHPPQFQQYQPQNPHFPPQFAPIQPQPQPQFVYNQAAPTNVPPPQQQMVNYQQPIIPTANYHNYPDPTKVLQPSNLNQFPTKIEMKEEEMKVEKTDYSEKWLQYYITIGDTAGAEGVRARIAAMKTNKSEFWYFLNF